MRIVEYLKLKQNLRAAGDSARFLRRICARRHIAKSRLGECIRCHE